MTGYERLKTIRAVARHYRPAEDYESWHALRDKLRQAERALATVAEMVDEYEVMLGKVPEQKGVHCEKIL